MKITVSENPYQAPEGDAEYSVQSTPPKITRRPLGILILATLQVVLGIGRLGSGFFLFFSHTHEIFTSSRIIIGFSEALLLILIAFLSGIGMHLKQKWGWCLAAFFYVYNIIAFGAYFFESYFLYGKLFKYAQIDMVTGMSYVVRTIIFLFITHYFFRQNVISYFQLDQWNRAKSFWIMLGISLALCVVSITLQIVI